MLMVAGLFDSPAEVGIIVFPVLIGGAIGYLIGKSKGQGPLGLVLGALLGCIGWVIVAVLPRKDQPGASGTPQSHRPGSIGGSQPAGAQWAPDPFGRFQSRYYDGTKWTEHVSTDGRQYTDDPTHCVASGRSGVEELRFAQWISPRSRFETNQPEKPQGRVSGGAWRGRRAATRRWPARC